jgi:cytochrome bd ubiquinol oxidase subunit II
MMLYIVIAFLWLAILFYLVLGGADFGAGILEIFTATTNRQDLRRTAYIAIGPIWEANHMWIIIAVVIFFVGFPEIYSTISISLHIPVLIMLLGIIARGTAFTFRNYDSINDKMQGLYSRIYIYSSFITPLFIGIIAATAVSGRIDPNAVGFLRAYIFNWLDWFPVSVGLFTVFLCGFLAAIFLTGEVGYKPSRGAYVQKARLMNLGVVVFMLLSFRTAKAENIPMFQWVFGSMVSIAAVVISFVAWIFTWYQISRNNAKLTRLWAGIMVMTLLVAITYGHFPDVVLLRGGLTLSLLSGQAPEATIKVLAIALLVGGLFIVPSLFYLIYSFSQKNKPTSFHKS